MSACVDIPRAIVVAPRSMARSEDDAKLCAGDEVAFARFAARHHGSLVRFAGETHAQEAWGDFLGALSDGGCTLRAELFRRAAERMREGGHPFAIGAHEPAVPADRFRPDEHRFGGGWNEPPKRFEESEIDPALVRAAIDALPLAMRAVLLLRDCAGFSLDEVCHALSLAESDVRSLLNGARARVRASIEAGAR